MLADGDGPLVEALEETPVGVDVLGQKRLFPSGSAYVRTVTSQRLGKRRVEDLGVGLDGWCSAAQVASDCAVAVVHIRGRERSSDR